MNMTQKSESEMSVLVDDKPRKKRQLRVCSNAMNTVERFHLWFADFRREEAEGESRTWGRLSTNGYGYNYNYSHRSPRMMKRSRNTRCKWSMFPIFPINANLDFPYPNRLLLWPAVSANNGDNESG